MKNFFTKEEIEQLYDEDITVISNGPLTCHITVLICEEYVDLYNCKNINVSLKEKIKILRNLAIEKYADEKAKRAVALHNTKILGMLGLTLNSDGTIENENL